MNVNNERVATATLSLIPNGWPALRLRAIPAGPPPSSRSASMRWSAGYSAGSGTTSPSSVCRYPKGGWPLFRRPSRASLWSACEVRSAINRRARVLVLMPSVSATPSAEGFPPCSCAASKLRTRSARLSTRGSASRSGQQKTRKSRGSRRVRHRSCSPSGGWPRRRTIPRCCGLSRSFAGTTRCGC